MNTDYFKNKCILKGAILTAALAFAGMVNAAPTYTFSSFDLPDQTYVCTGINDNGQIVGSFNNGNPGWPTYGRSFAFVRRGSTYTTLGDPTPTTGWMVATGINKSGQIVGYYGDPNVGIQGFLRDSNGVYRTIAPPEAMGWTFATGINNNGQVVGHYHDGTVIGGNGHQPAFVESGGVYTTLADPSPTTIYNFAAGINNSGVVAGSYQDDNGYGYYGYVRSSDGTYTILPTVYVNGFGDVAPTVRGINDSGQVLVYFRDGGCTDVYSGGQYTPIMHPNAHEIGGCVTFSYGINNKGQIAGNYSDGQGVHGFVAYPWSPTYKTDLHDFDGPTDGGQATYTGQLAQGRDGNLYGTTPTGGALGHGTAFKITPAGSFTKLHDFDGITDGGEPYGGLTLGKDGNFYGTTAYGGTGYYGTVFKMTPTGAVTVLHHFYEGNTSYAAPVQGRDGNFYGTTFQGGTSYVGIVYKITPSGTFSVLYNFDYTHGAYPIAPLIVGNDGNFYGTTTGGGTGSQGTVFKITPSGALTVLYNFNYNAIEAGTPYSPLVQSNDNNFYGATLPGGGSWGNIFKVTPEGVTTNLYSFATSADPWGVYPTPRVVNNGLFPTAGLLLGNDGNFYGVTSSGVADATCGVLFQITPAGAYSVRYIFDSTHGCTPNATPFMHTNGKIYGLTNKGGANGQGVLYGLNVGAPAFVTAIPGAAKAGATIGLLGNLKGATSVQFNGITANLSGASNTYRTAVVPAGATTGPITVVTASGALTSNKTFFVMPTLTGFSPASGPVGSSVVLTGASLTQTTGVTFAGNKPASFTVDNDGQVTATVPVGAVKGRITITTAGGTATSATSFTVTK